MRFSAISLMCSRPSVPGKISTNAPKSTSRTTLPRYVLPISADGRDVGDDLDAPCCAEASSARSHVHRAVVLDVDLDAGLLDDAADHLAARSDHVANLIGRNRAGCRCAERTATSSARGSAIASSILSRM